MDKLTNILDKTLHMACLEANRLAARILELTLASLTNIRPTENRSSTVDYGTPVQDFLSVRLVISKTKFIIIFKHICFREWAKPQKIQDLKIDWYVPKEKEINAVQSLVNKYLIPELDTLNKYVSGEIKLTRQELKCTLKIVISILSCHLLLPIWEEPTYKL